MNREKKLSLGQKVEQKKIEKRLSNNALARMVNVSGQTIANIITGVTEQPKPSLIVNLARALEVTVDWLIEDEDESLKQLMKSGGEKKYDYTGYKPLDYSHSITDQRPEAREMSYLEHQLEMCNLKNASLEEKIRLKDEALTSKNEMIEMLQGRVKELEAKIAVAREIVKGSKDEMKLF